MNDKSYNQFKLELQSLHKQKKYELITLLLNEAQKQLSSTEYEEYYFEIMFSKAYFYSELNDFNNCFSVIKTLVHNGFACPLDWNRFKPLEKFNDYQYLLDVNDKIKNSLTFKFQYLTLLPNKYDSKQKYPLFIILHGDGSGGNIRDFKDYWDSTVLLEKGYIVLYIQSSQFLYHNNFGWLNNPSQAKEDIKECYQLISKSYLIDESQIIIGGFSGGAITSIDIALSNTLPVKGFISLCPILIPEAFSRINVKEAASRNIKGVMIEGELCLPIANEEYMMKIFNEEGLIYKYYINKNIGHDVPEDFSLILNESVNFILK